MQDILFWINNNTKIVDLVFALISLVGAVFSFFYYKKAKRYSLLLIETQLMKEIKEQIISNRALHDLDNFNTEDVKRNIGFKGNLKIIHNALFQLTAEGKLISKDLCDIRDVKNAKFSFIKMPYVAYMGGIKKG